MALRSPLSSSVRSLLASSGPSTSSAGAAAAAAAAAASASSRATPARMTVRSYSDRPPSGPIPPPHAAPSSPSASSSSSASTPSSSASSSASDQTHFGFKTIPSSEKETLVGSVFSSVASKYDVMNDAMSLGIHRLWKDHFVQKLDPRGGIKVLDVAGGTGDIALRILDHARTAHYDRETSVTVLDINPSMLVEGQKRFKQSMYWNTPQVSFQLGNAENLAATMDVPPLPARGPNSKQPLLPQLESKPIADQSIDLYTVAFGIRNCTHIDRVLQEAYRVLKPGGVFACLEFGKVTVPLLAQIYRQYSFNFIPPLGQLLAGDRESYQYLIESIERFPTQPNFARMIRDAGFHLPGSPAATSLGFPAIQSSLLGGGGPAAAAPRDEDRDVLGAWEDLSLGIASIWMGVKV